jgi:serine/threonine-protein kinase
MRPVMARSFPEVFMSLEEFVPVSIRRAWVCSLTVEGAHGTESLIGFRLALLQPGLWPPDLGTGVAIDEGCVRVTTALLENQDVDEALVRVAQHEVPAPIRDLLRRDVTLPQGDSPARWNVREEDASISDRPATRVAERSPVQLSKLMTSEQFTRAGEALRFRAQSIAGLKGMAMLMGLRDMIPFHEHQHAASIAQVDTRLPVFVRGSGYAMEHLGYRFTLQIGGALPRGDVLLALGAPFNKGYRADDAAWQPTGEPNDELREWTLVIPSEELTTEVEWHLAYRRQAIAKGTWRARSDFGGALIRTTKAVQIRLPYSSWTLYEDRRLGKAGGFGEVFEGEGRSGGIVAIKRLKPEFTGEGQRELTAARELIRHNHPHIIPILDAGIHQDRAYVVMERAARNLEEFVKLGLPSEREVIEILDALAQGLDEIGNRVHRDLKPANVLFHGDTWKIGDLGLVRSLEASTSTNTVKDWHTPDYAAPEQFRGGPFSKKTDVYAIGCIGYFLLTGKPPFQGENLAEQHARAQPPRLPIPDSLRIPIERCLAKGPDARPSPRDLSAMLRTFLQPPPADPITAVGQRLKQRAELARIQQDAEYQQHLDRRQRSKEAIEALVTTFKAWLASIVDASEDQARITRELDGRRLELGQACVFLRSLSDGHPVLPQSGWDIEASALLACHWSSRGIARQRSCNLWFSRRPEEEDHQWCEVAFTRKGEPAQGTFGLEHESLWPQADAALAGKDPFLQLASEPLPVTMNVNDPFFVRWREVLARAALDEEPSLTEP